MNTLDIITERLDKCIGNTIIATTELDEDQQIIDFCRDKNISCFMGSENNVLSRFIMAALKMNCNNIIRICSDNPFIDSELCKNLIYEYDKDEYDYVTYSYNNKACITFDHGVYCEVIRLQALQKCLAEANTDLDFEHVTRHIYLNPNDFKIKFIEAENLWGNINPVRLTLDTEEDLIRIKNLFNYLSPSDYSFKSFLKKLKDDDNFYKLNKQGIEK